MYDRNYFSNMEMSLVDQRYAVLNGYLRRRPEQPQELENQNLLENEEEPQPQENNAQQENAGENPDDDNNMLINQLI